MVFGCVRMCGCSVACGNRHSSRRRGAGRARRVANPARHDAGALQHTRANPQPSYSRASPGRRHQPAGVGSGGAPSPRFAVVVGGVLGVMRDGDAGRRRSEPAFRDWHERSRKSGGASCASVSAFIAHRWFAWTTDAKLIVVATRSAGKASESEP